MSDYPTALKVWQSGRNGGDGGTMPEAFRIRPALKRSSEQAAAFDRVRAWTRERFRLADDAPVLVSEINCKVPGCPPLETVVAFWTEGDKRHHFKVFKPVALIDADDLPPGWMKNALMALDGIDCACC